jgi:hypothetical protein
MAVTSFRRCSTLADPGTPDAVSAGSVFPDAMGAVVIGMLLGTRAFGQGW